MSERSAALVEHYHQTYDLTFKLWKERNRAFLLLITTLAIAALISYDPRAFQDRTWAIPGLVAAASDAATTRNTFLLTAMCYAVKEDDCKPGSETIAHFAKTFPHDAFDGIISIIVLYLMLNITNLTSTIFRYYSYINRLENEVRTEMQIGRWSVAFAREGQWYERHHAPMQVPIRYFYVLLLTGMLGFYFFVRIAGELHAGGNFVRLAGHGGIALLSVLALYGYAVIILGWARSANDQGD